VFEEALVNEVSDVFETPTAFYIIEVLEKTEPGTMTLDESRPMINARLAQDKKLNMIRDVARQALDKVRAGTPLEQAAQAAGAKVEEAGPFTRLDFVPGLGRANAAIGTAFGLKVGETSDVVESEGSLYIIQTLEKVEANRAEYDTQRSAQQMRIAQAMSEQRWNQFLQALKAQAKIEDNRKTLLRPLADTASN
jgi:parvulin-like peptidyl-prolyl isomerase